LAEDGRRLHSRAGLVERQARDDAVDQLVGLQVGPCRVAVQLTRLQIETGAGGLEVGR
jgi:hypothetical protein